MNFKRNIPALLIAAAFLEGVFSLENTVLRIAGIVLVLALFAIVILLPKRKAKKNKSAVSSAKPDDSLENGSLGVLIPIDDESDLGELLEVKDLPSDNSPPILEKTFDAPIEINQDNDDLEELETLEEAVEELEPVED